MHKDCSYGPHSEVDNWRREFPGTTFRFSGFCSAYGGKQPVVKSQLMENILFENDSVYLQAPVHKDISTTLYWLGEVTLHVATVKGEIVG